MDSEYETVDSEFQVVKNSQKGNVYYSVEELNYIEQQQELKNREPKETVHYDEKKYRERLEELNKMGFKNQSRNEAFKEYYKQSRTEELEKYFKMGKLEKREGENRLKRDFKPGYRGGSNTDEGNSTKEIRKTFVYDFDEKLKNNN